ncbi:DUF262 domain-containing protein [Ramlibacter sp.]|uniref:DUF262 domain-containing protein n=1 Tax=Ramlibacter sp. TaxID=1917967 RepID=UPI002B5961D6|nr:DUF262 domain-containing protein [Ramlibacter sp.]HWI81511.1 DUF262 domain-containing protein [Ramlibacter sp.]
MSDFRLGTIPSSSILHLYSLRDSIWFDPPYQRASDVWPPEKRRLLIDSILNGYDVPKLYFHEFFPAKVIGGKKYKYAIVDGKQRLETIFKFIEGKFALSEDIEFIAEPTRKLAGLTYAELAREYPDLKTRFDGFSLPIISILTEDTELIEDMFSRLNEAVPLSAAEKRNALGGVVPIMVRDMSRHTFFTAKLPFENRRYRHFDLATKFLLLSEKDHLIDTKKRQLDEFVKSHREDNELITLATAKAVAVLDAMAAVFVDDDPLLRSVGSVTIYYYLFMDAINNEWKSPITRSALDKFEQIRLKNRADAEQEMGTPDFHLLEYDRFAQSPNDAVALRYRYAVLRAHVGPEKGRPTIPSDED